MKQPAVIPQQKHYLPTLLIIAFVLLCPHVMVRAAALPKTASLVPSETAVLIEFEDFRVFKDQYERTTLCRLCKDPVMKSFVDDFQTNLRDMIDKDGDSFQKAIFDIGQLPQGRVAFALVLNPQQAATAGQDSGSLLAITQWGEGIEKVRQAADKILASASEKGARVQKDDYRGLTITTIDKGPDKALSYSIDGDCLMVSSDPEVLKFTIAHLKGATSATLADESDYLNAGKALAPYSQGHIAAFVNIKHIINTQLPAANAGQIKGIIAGLGLDNVVSLALKLGPGDLSSSPGAYSYGKVFLRIDGAKKGICKILEFDSAPVTMPQFIPADVLSIALFNIDLKGAFDELYKIAATFSPQAGALLNMPLLPPSPQGDPGVTLKSNIIAHLGSQILVAQSANKNLPTGPDSDASPIDTTEMLAIALSNRSELERSISRLHAEFIQAGQSQSKRDLLGHTMYLIDLSAFVPTAGQPASYSSPSNLLGLFSPGAMQLPPGSPETGPSAPSVPAPKMALTFTDTHLVFGPETAVERAIRTLEAPAAESLARTTWFTKAKSQVPSVVGMAGFEDNAASGEILWKMLKQLGEQQSKTESSDSSIGFKIGPNLMLPTGNVTKLFNFKLLPEFEAVRKYFGLSATYGVSRPDGFLMDLKYIESD